MTILIVGAGPTGLMAAASIARFGVAVRLIDRASEPPADRSRAAVVQPRTLEAFDNLGIAQEAIGAGTPVDSVELYKPSGTHATLTFAEPGWLDSPYDKLLSLPQDQTERILTELCTRLGITIERGVQLVGLSQSADAVRATLRHADGANETVDAEWVVGADGAHSTVRELSGLTFPGLTYADDGLIGDVDIEWKLSHDSVSLCPRPEGFLLAFPLPGDRHFRTIMIVPSVRPTEDRTLSMEEFRSRLEYMTPHGCGSGSGSAPPKILRSHWLTRYRLHRRGVTSYSRGRVFVGGDAAHIHSPVGAQGMNTGIQDAYNLAWKLALVARGEAPAWLLETYDEERRHIGELLLNGTDKAFGFVAGRGWFARTVRRIAPTLAARALSAPVIGKTLARFVSQLQIKYRESRLSVEGSHAASLGAHAPHAGDRAPDVHLSSANGQPVRLFDEFREPRHVLVVFEGNSTTANAAPGDGALPENMKQLVKMIRLTRATTGSRDGARLDSDGAAHDRYGAANGALYLVRPDGYIGFRGSLEDWSDLRTDLARRFLVS
ncbi:MAG TPA: FAD-dependent monooxygenase [Gemmatimonadaceae bacterium]|nr:FAD-dependent monooxygenase [Gemmatimonadaceae bacterium]